MRRHLLAMMGISVAAVVACGGSTAGNGGGGSGGSVSGSVGGTSFTFGSGLAIAGQVQVTACSGFADGGTTCTTTPDGYLADVALLNLTTINCGLLQAVAGSNDKLAGADEILLQIGDHDAPIAAGTYDIILPNSGPTRGAVAQFTTADATCATGLDLTADGGSVVVTAVSATSISGNYTVSFGTQGSFTGSFDLPLCAIPDAGTTSSASDGGACIQ